MIVETMKQGECTIVIHNDAYINKDPEAVRKIIQKASAIVYASGIKKAADKA